MTISLERSLVPEGVESAWHDLNPWFGGNCSMVWRKLRWCARRHREFRGISNFGAELGADFRTQPRYQTVSTSLLHHVKLCTLQDVGGGGAFP